VDFGVQSQNRQKNPDVEFSLHRLKMLTPRVKLNAANSALRRVYRSREFVSFAAAIRPEEDLVETFKYKVLADAMPNGSLDFRLDGRDVNVLDLLKSDIPAKKVECLRALGMLTGQP
jgi:hypothetical protein